MFKIFLYLVILVLVVIGSISIYHTHNVAQKNKSEMLNFEKQIPLQANLGKVLVVYYSLSGHTKDIASQIAQKTNADVYEIKTIKTYTSPSVYMESKKELTSKNYPEIQPDLPNVAGYDVVFVGSPVWWYTMAPALYSFLKKVDFQGVRVVPFSTQGSNYGSFFTDFKDNAKNAKLLKSENFNNVGPEYDAAVSNKINNWLNKL